VTFNPGAIPVAVLLLLFAYLVGTRRERMIDRYYRRRGKDRSGFGYRFQMRYAIFMSVVAVVLAGCALFADFGT
jgi:hypothetical protein